MKIGIKREYIFLEIKNRRTKKERGKIMLTRDNEIKSAIEGLQTAVERRLQELSEKEKVSNRDKAEYRELEKLLDSLQD